MRCGYGRSIFEPLLPLIIGRDISGEVAATGTLASSFSIGQEVFGSLHPTALRGTYADYAILSLDELTLKPSTLSHVVGIIKLISSFCASSLFKKYNVRINFHLLLWSRSSTVLLSSLNLGEPVVSCTQYILIYSRVVHKLLCWRRALELKVTNDLWFE